MRGWLFVRILCIYMSILEYSLLDGAIRIKDLIRKVKELGMESIAITDHGVMYGVVDFYKEAVKTV